MQPEEQADKTNNAVVENPSTPVEDARAEISATGKPLGKSNGKRKRLWLAAGVVGVIVLIGGGTAAAYYGLIVPNQPQRIAQEAVANTLNQDKVQSAYFEGDVTFEGGDVSESVSGVTFKGAISKTGAIDLNVSISTVLTKIGLDVTSDDGKTLYLKVSGLKGLDQLVGAFAGASSTPEQTAALTSLITSINDNWFMIDQSLLKQFGGEAGSLTTSTLSNEDAKRLGEIYKNHQFIEVHNKLASEDIHGVPSHHFHAGIDKDQLVGFLNEVKAANIASLPVEQSTIDQVNKVDFTKYPIELWVSKKDRLLTQVSTSFDESGTKYKVRVALYDFNKSVTIQKPDNAKSILELLTSLAPLANGFIGGTGLASDSPLNL